jgi:ATP-dependent Clp protease ATP-binding subunit ClpX
MIPEFIGRLPVVSTLNDLNQDDLFRILTEPKDAIIKQYKKLFELENVELRFTDGALRAIAKLSEERKTGARGLRAIIEETMLHIMYEIPSRKDITECVVNEDVILSQEQPILLFEPKTETA